jgi:hypothetical protein
MGSRDSSVGIATVYWLDDQVTHFSLLHRVQTVSVSHQASYPRGSGAHFPVVNRPGREADDLLSSGAEVNNNGAIPPLPHMPSWHSD